MKYDQDTELLRDLRSRNVDAFEKMVRELSPRLLASATRVLRNPDEARDAVQEGLISAWRNIGQFEGSASISTWLHRIVINACLARLRSSRFSREVAAPDGDHVANSQIAGLPAAWSEPGVGLEKRVAMRRAIQNALDMLPEEFRVVLLLRDVEELSSKETADQIGVSDSLVRQRLHRARTIMAEMLRPELCSGPELTCGGQLDLLLDYIDQALPQELQTPVHDHITGCPACSELLRQYRETVGIPRAIVALTAEPVDESFVRATIASAYLPPK